MFSGACPLAGEKRLPHDWRELLTNVETPGTGLRPVPVPVTPWAIQSWLQPLSAGSLPSLGIGGAVPLDLGSPPGILRLCPKPHRNPKLPRLNERRRKSAPGLCGECLLGSAGDAALFAGEDLADGVDAAVLAFEVGAHHHLADQAGGEHHQAAQQEDA